MLWSTLNVQNAKDIYRLLIRSDTALFDKTLFPTEDVFLTFVNNLNTNPLKTAAECAVYLHSIERSLFRPLSDTKQLATLAAGIADNTDIMILYNNLLSVCVKIFKWQGDLYNKELKESPLDIAQIATYKEILLVELKNTNIPKKLERHKIGKSF